MAIPLILTLAIDTEAQAFFNRLRKQHFPPERNYIDAHLTLFHHLPHDEELVYSLLAALSAQQRPINLLISKVTSIGNGTAYVCDSAELRALHHKMQLAWANWLTPQDKQKLWPHITIQNKVSADAARHLLDHLSATFKPFEITGTGLTLWRYLGGPWEFVAEYPFKTTSADDH